MTMDQPDDADAADDASMADDVAAELARHSDAMSGIMSEHGMMPDDAEGEGSQQD
jgi:hypothetical protein